MNLRTPPPSSGSYFIYEVWGRRGPFFPREFWWDVLRLWGKQLQQGVFGATTALYPAGSAPPCSQVVPAGASNGGWRSEPSGALRRPVRLLAGGHSRRVHTSLEEPECLPSTLTTAQTPSPTNKQQAGRGAGAAGAGCSSCARLEGRRRHCLFGCLSLRKRRARLSKYLHVQLEAGACLWSAAVSPRRPLVASANP